jgi:hypothetical protein
MRSRVHGMRSRPHPAIPLPARSAVSRRPGHKPGSHNRHIEPRAGAHPPFICILVSRSIIIAILSAALARTGFVVKSLNTGSIRLFHASPDRPIIPHAG